MRLVHSTERRRWALRMARAMRRERLIDGSVLMGVLFVGCPVKDAFAAMVFPPVSGP
jgi:hypothetical protein